MTVSLPSVISKVQRLGRRTSGLFFGGGSPQRLMYADLIVVTLELFEFLCQIHFVPEERSIQILSPDRSDEPLHKGVAQARQLHPIVLIWHKSFGSPTPIIRCVVGSLNCCAGITVGEIIESGFIMTPDS